MAEPRSKKRIEIVHFHKPADRSRTLPEFATPAPRDTAPETPSAGRRRRTPKTIELAVQDGAGPPAPDGGAPMTPQQVAEMALFGHHLFEQGKVPEAKIVFEGLVGLGVKDPFPHTMLGIIYFAEKDSARALALFEEALALDPHDRAARVYRAEIRLANGKVRQALDELGKIVRLGPKGDPFAERARKLIDAAGQGTLSAKRKRRT